MQESAKLSVIVREMLTTLLRNPMSESLRKYAMLRMNLRLLRASIFELDPLVSFAAVEFDAGRCGSRRLGDHI